MTIYKHSLLDIVNTILELNEKQDKYYSKNDIQSKVRQYLNNHPYIDINKELRSGKYYYTDNIKDTCLINMKLDTLNYDTKSDLYEKAFRNLKYSGLVYNNNYYVTLENIIEYLNYRYQININYDELNSKINQYDDSLNPIYYHTFKRTCNNFTHQYYLIEKHYPLSKLNWFEDYFVK